MSDDPVRDVARLREEPKARCEGRYPVPQTSPARDEPFDVTYRCALPEGHDGPHGDVPDAAPSGAGGRGAATQGPVLCERCGEPDEPNHEFGFRDHAFRDPRRCKACDGEGLIFNPGTSNSTDCGECGGNGWAGGKEPGAAPADAEAGRREALELLKEIAQLPSPVFFDEMDVVFQCCWCHHDWPRGAEESHGDNCLWPRALKSAALSGAPHGDGQAGTAAEEKK